MGEVIMDGLKAMVVGMGMVYVFLIVMIFIMTFMSKLLKPFAGMLVKAPAAPKAKKAKAPAAGALSEADKLLAKVAIQAVKMHRGETK